MLMSEPSRGSVEQVSNRQKWNPRGREETMALVDLQRLLAEALPQRDAAAALCRPSAYAVSPQESDAVQRLPEDGLLLTSLVLVKLRMQQLLKSHREAARQFEFDPETFVAPV